MFKALTGVRAVAAIWVVCGHFSLQLSDLFPPIQSLFPIIHSGFLGVDLFFVLSGFILAHNYLEEFRRVTPGRYGRFLWLRLARLYPVHLVCLFILLGGVSAGSLVGVHFNMPQRLGLADFLRNVVLIHAWGFGDETSWNGPAWSISAECFAYLLFPFIAMVVVRVRSVGFALTIASALYAVLLGAFGYWGTTWTTLANDLALVRVATQFTVGCLLYRVHTFGWRNPLGWEAVAWLALIGMVAYAFVYPPHVAASLAPAPLMAVMVLALASAGGPMGKFLGRPSMIFWGEVSYSLYMTHDLVRMALNKLLNTQQFADSAPGVRAGVLMVYVMCVAGAALGMYFIVEKPVRRWMRSIVGRGRPVDEAQLPSTDGTSGLHAGDTHRIATGTMG